MRNIAALTLLLLASAPAWCQSITVPATVKVEETGLVVIRATEIDADDVHWYALTKGIQTFPADVVQAKPGVFMGIAMKEGTYKIGVVAAKDIGGKAKIGVPQVVTVVVGSGTPTPPVPVPPGPVPPNPTPGAKAAWAIAVYEAGTNYGQKVNAVLADADLFDSLGLKWRKFDKDNATVQKNGYLKYQAEAGGLPFLILMDASGKKLRAVRVPDDPAKLQSLVKEVQVGK
jgi:hypothetical protein